MEKELANLPSKLSVLADFVDIAPDQCKLLNLSDKVLQTCSKMVGISQASFMVFDAISHQLQYERTLGYETQRKNLPRIEMTEDVTRWLYEGGEVLALAEENPQKFLLIFDEQESFYFNCEIRFPFFICDKVVGVLSLGEKSDGTNYSVAEIDLLRTIVSTARMRLEYLLVCKSSMSDYESKKTVTPDSFRSRGIRTQKAPPELLGESESMHKVFDLIERVAPNDATVLITGESGTGKELVAKAIHKSSLRQTRPLIAMNCAALPDGLVEAELFGHEKGSFTGAINQKQGKFEAAHQSTLFLDEIGDMSVATQAKVLRVLQDGTFQRVGGHGTLSSDVRLIAATHRNLHADIAQGKFREDLYYRIAVVQIDLPSLRERGDDIVLLAESFFTEFNNYYNRNLQGISPDVIDWLLQYNFPGNVRELRNMIERAVIMESGNWVSLNFIPIAKLPPVGTANNQVENITLEELEKRHIKEIVRRAKFNKSLAARNLGIARKTLREKMEKYGIRES